MKLSTSSSIFLATLALSSSTSTLALPARDATESSLSVSPSSNDLFDSSVHPSGHCSAHGVQPQPTPAEDKPQALAARDPSQDTFLTLLPLLGSLPIIGPLINKILGPVRADGVDGVGQAISAEDITALQAAVGEVSRAINNTIPNPLAPAHSVASGIPIVAQNDFDPASGSAAVPSSASPTPSAQSSAQAASNPFANVNDVPSSSSSSPSSSASPPSPSIPANPPNSPLSHFPL